MTAGELIGANVEIGRTVFLFYYSKCACVCAVSPAGLAHTQEGFPPLAPPGKSMSTVCCGNISRYIILSIS